MAHKISPKISAKSVSLPQAVSPAAVLPQNNPFGQAGREFGRISGPLLSANLLRNGHDLSFETDLLYLSVNSGFVGIKNSTPVRALDMGGSATTDNLIVDTEADLGVGFQITTNQIFNTYNLPITLYPNQSSNPTIAVNGGLNTANLNFATNTITGTANANINITPFQNPNYVTNGDFETGTLSGWTVLGSVSTITIADSTNAATGNYALSASSYITKSTVSQTLATAVGQTYIITFALKNTINLFLTTEDSSSIMTTEDANNILSVVPATNSGQADFSVLWNGVALTGGSPVGTGPSLPYSSPASSYWEYTKYSFTVTASGSDVLTFSLRNDNAIFYLDSVSTILQGTTGGITQINSNTLVNGALHATGDITFDGNIQLGDAVTDRISIPAEVASDIIPLAGTTTITPVTVAITDQLGNALTTQTSIGLFTNPGASYTQSASYNLGSSALEWNNVWLKNANLSSALTSNTVTTTALTAGNISISSNKIGDGTADLNLSTLGIGQVKINGSALFSGNTINNPSFSSPYFTAESGSYIIVAENSVIIAAEVTALPLEIINTGIGYTVFSGTGAIEIPAGSTAEQPASPQLGMTRYNTTIQTNEIWNGTSWQNLAGVSASSSVESDQTTIWSLILG